MGTTIIIMIGIIFLFVIVGLGFFFYSLINSKNNNMNGEAKTKALDIFVYLGIGISLVVSVTNILQIIFTAIDRKFPDVLNMAYVDTYSSDVRLAIASLVVMYPIYLGLSWYTAKDISKFLYKRDLTIRKIVIYTTLFITACTLIGTLVSVIYTYLGGELTTRFILKAISVFVVALLVCGYYLYSVRRDYTQKSSVPVISSIVVSILVIASIMWSVSVIGTPAEMRAKRIDSERLSALSSLQQQVFNYFQTTDTLPNKLSDLNNAFQGYSVPVDPVTGESYVYRIVQLPVVKINYTTTKKELITPAIFEICSNFDIARDVNQNGQTKVSVPSIPASTDSTYSVSNYYYDGDQSPFWNHGIGETCFKRVISSDMYYNK